MGENCKKRQKLTRWTMTWRLNICSQHFKKMSIPILIRILLVKRNANTITPQDNILTLLRKQKAFDKLQLYMFFTINAKNNTITPSCGRGYALSDDFLSESLLIEHTADSFSLFDFLHTESDIASLSYEEESQARVIR